MGELLADICLFVVEKKQKQVSSVTIEKNEKFKQAIIIIMYFK